MRVRSIIFYYLSTILLSFISTVILVFFLTNWLLISFIENSISIFFGTSAVGVGTIIHLLSYLN